MEIEVKGHSGCQIGIVNDGVQLYISKSTHDPKYIPRLLKLAEKQQAASQNFYQHIRIPQVYGITKTDSSLDVKMEYVYSKNFVDYFEDAGFDQIDYFVKALKIFIDDEMSKSISKGINREVITNKFASVKEIVRSNALLNEDVEIKEILEASDSVFYHLEEVCDIPLGVCHGDLTFSNILFNGNNYYLIDFLDSFIESPLMDLVKIRQDSCYGWSLLMYGREYDKVRMNIISRKIDNEIDKYYGGYDWYQRYYKPMQLMNFLRVLQYAKETKVINYLKTVIKTLL